MVVSFQSKMCDAGIAGPAFDADEAGNITQKAGAS
jgi:hypothetical protein